MTTPLEYNVAPKPSMVYHADDSTNILIGSKAGKVRTLNVDATGTVAAPVVKDIGMYTHEGNGVLGTDWYSSRTRPTTA